MKNMRIILLSAIVLAAPCTAHATTINGICYGNHSSSVRSGTFDPNDPSTSGYSLVFDSEFNNFNDFDLTCNSAPTNGGCVDPPGKNWYLNGWTFFPNNTTNKATDLAISNGILSIHQSIKTGNWAITTMGPHNGASQGPAVWQQNWNGKVFGGGWYVESRISGEYKNSSGNVVPAPDYAPGHISIWSYPVDHYTGANHFAENDMLDGEQGTDFYLTNSID